MGMTTTGVRLGNNPVLTGLLLGASNAGAAFIAQELFPMLPQALRSVQIGAMGNEAMRRYNLKRAPGGPTKRIDIKWQGKVYNLDQYSVEVLIPREVIQETDTAARLNVGLHIQASSIAMQTASDILALGYEIEVAELAADADLYPDDHVLPLSGAAKWSASTGTPVTDVRTAAEVIRRATGRRPNKLVLPASVLVAVAANPEVRSYLPSTQMGPATLDQLANIFQVTKVVVGDAVWMDADDTGTDVWGNNAVLAFAPDVSPTGVMSLATPAFGFTNVLEGHPLTETPYYVNELRSWVYGATYERRPNVGRADAGFLFQNPV